MQRFMHKLMFVISGLIIWVRLGIPFWDAMDSAIEAEEIIWENRDQ